ncbi:putative PWI domain-containing protein [Plasmopara halstedii]
MDGEDKELLREWLIRSLDPVCDADPEVLSKYVLALVQNDPQKPELQEMCVSKLDEFLGDETVEFVGELFNALADGSYKANNVKIQGDEPSQDYNGYKEDYHRQRERPRSDDEDEQRRYIKRRRDDNHTRDDHTRRHQESPRRDRRQLYPLRDGNLQGPMNGRGPYGMGHRNHPPEWGMWPPHFPPTHGAGYPSDFEPGMYIPENGGMMPPPHMMMPHPMNGRGPFYPFEGRGSRGGRGNYHAGRIGKVGEMSEPPNAKTTLHVRHVDPKHVNMTMLMCLCSIRDGRGGKKSVPVCNNRFISVKWAKHDAQNPEEIGGELTENALNGKESAPANSEFNEKSAEGKEEPNNGLSESNMTTEELRAAALEKGRKVLEEKRELLEKQRELKKQKEALIKRHLSQQKELLERMSANSSQFSIAEKRNLLSKITALSRELKALTPR